MGELRRYVEGRIADLERLSSGRFDEGQLAALHDLLGELDELEDQ